MKAPWSELTVVIPSWNTSDMLVACLDSLAPALAGGAQVVVVDNASSDDSAMRVARDYANVVLLRNDQNEGFARACNQGAGLARGSYLCFLNADTEVGPQALEQLLAFLDEHSGYAACAPHLFDDEGNTQHSCMAFPNLWTPFFFSTPLERWFPKSDELERYFARSFSHESDADVEQPPAAALLIRRETFVELDGFDEDLWLFFNDVDLCRRLAQRGDKIRYLSAPQVLHHEGASTRQFDDFAGEWHRNRLTYYRKHHGRMAGVWVKLCTTLSWFDHVFTAFGRRLKGEPMEPLYPLCRSFGTFLIS